MVKVVNGLLLIVENALVGVFGNYWFIGLAVLVLFIILLVFKGVDFRYSLILLAPCLLRLAEGGWLPNWSMIFIWFIVVGFGLYLAWNNISPY